MNHLMNRRIRMPWLLVVALVAGSVGCVSQSTQDKLLTSHRRGQEQIVDLKSRLAEANARIRAMEDAPPAPDQEALDRLAKATAERNKLIEALTAAEASLLELSQQKPMLPDEVHHALEELARSHTDLMSYDPVHGMVKLKSDLTFALGSAVVSTNGANSLRGLAQILNGPAAASYDARIVGHTDNVPIGRNETRRLHPTNWHLSVHRAISVQEVIEKSGVKPRRTLVAGRAEHHPIVPNGPRGAEANRRVEIFLVSSVAPEPPGATAEASVKVAPGRASNVLK